MIARAGRHAALLVLSLALAACGGAENPPAATSEPSSAQADDYEAPAIEVPEDCPPTKSQLELWTHAASWADEKIKPYPPNEVCLVTMADQAFTFTLHNPKTKGVINMPHNFSIYRDSAALDRLFYEKPVASGKEKTIEIPPLDAGTYLFRCDLHAQQQMKGVLVVE